MLPEKISLKEFNYNLTEERIAKYPLSNRDDSKLLFCNKDNLSHHKFAEINNLLPKDCTLLFNKSKVVPARLEFFKDSGTRIEIFLLEPYQMEYSQVFTDTERVLFKVLVGNKKRWRPGQCLTRKTNAFTLNANWVEREQNYIELTWDGGLNFSAVLEEMGKIPLPPYLNRESEEQDAHTYQTVYAEEPGAVAAPTAGLHFTNKVMNNLQQKRIALHKMTLHVSAGTFLPVTVENVLDHPMHNEVFYFDRNDVETVLNSNNLIPVGTTSMRMAESLYWMGVALLRYGDTSFSLDKFFPYQNQDANYALTEIRDALCAYLELNKIEKVRAGTRLMIVPGYQPKVCKGIVTNFHQPCSTLIMLIAALLGDDWRKVYDAALENNYRFLSYGDSSLLIW